MALSRTVRRIERDLYDRLGRHLSDYERALIEAWAAAWAITGVEVEAALQDMIIAAQGGRVTRTMMLRNQRLMAALEALEPALERALSRTTVTITVALRDSIQAAATAEAAMLAAQLPAEIGVGSTLPTGTRLIGASPEQIAAIVDRVTQRIHAQTWPLASEARVAIKRELLRGITVGANPRVAARRALTGIADLWDGGLSRATTIAITEMNDAHRNAAQLVDRANADIMAGWRWEAHLGPRTCRSCLARHGQMFSIDEPGPHDHPRGRCARIPVTKSWAELGFKNVSEPRPAAGRSAEAYFNRLSESNQRAILGSRGYEAWKRGDYPMSSWSRLAHNDDWRDAYVATVPPKLA